MKTHEAYVAWSGDLESGEGRFELGSGASTGFFDAEARSRGGFEASPEELLGAAHAASFTLALTEALAATGRPVQSIEIRAEIRMGEAGGRDVIERIVLHARGQIPGLRPAEFRKCAATARDNCVLSLALSEPAIILDSKLEPEA